MAEEHMVAPNPEISTNPLHETLQAHIGRCDQCRTTLDKGSPRGFGARTQMCAEYLRIVRAWSDGVMP